MSLITVKHASQTHTSCEYISCAVAVVGVMQPATIRNARNSMVPFSMFNNVRRASHRCAAN